MNYDIYGNRLEDGFCEVHPHVAQEYPCALCVEKRAAAVPMCGVCGRAKSVADSCGVPVCSEACDREARREHDDKILENDIQYMLRGCDPHDAEARRHIARCIIAYVREHDGRDAERLRKGLSAVRDLINESTGVYGLHLNGDVSPWDELRTGGRFGEWLMDFDAAIDAAMRAEG